MCEIADDHQGIIAEQLAEGADYTPVRRKTVRRPAENNVDWAAYFERNRQNIQESVNARAAARATKQQGGAE